MNKVVEERVVGQHAPPCPMVARGKFEDGEVHDWDIMSAISIERTREDGSRDTHHDVTIILDGGHVAMLIDAMHDDIPGGLWAEWQILHA